MLNPTTENEAERRAGFPFGKGIQKDKAQADLHQRSPDTSSNEKRPMSNPRKGRENLADPSAAIEPATNFDQAPTDSAMSKQVTENTEPRVDSKRIAQDSVNGFILSNTTSLLYLNVLGA